MCSSLPSYADCRYAQLPDANQRRNNCFASNRLLNDNKQSHICANFLQLDLQEVGRKIYRRNAYILHVTETICMIYSPVTLTRSSFPIVVHRYLMHIILDGPLSQKTKKITAPKHQTFYFHYCNSTPMTQGIQ